MKRTREYQYSVGPRLADALRRGSRKADAKTRVALSAYANTTTAIKNQIQPWLRDYQDSRDFHADRRANSSNPHDSPAHFPIYADSLSKTGTV